MSRHVIDIHLVDSVYGLYFLGNMQFPGTIDSSDMVVKVIPDDEEEEPGSRRAELKVKLMEILQELLKDETNRFHWSVEIEPRRKKKPNGERRSGIDDPK